MNNNKLTSEYMLLNKPYKFINSYYSWDRQLFFGREEDSKRFVSKVNSNRFVIFYAPSGAGKTSLLQASIIPKLEFRGYKPVHIRLGDDPVIETQSQIIASLYPLLTSEVNIIKKAAVSLYETQNSWGDVSIDELLNKYDRLLITDYRVRSLLIPVIINEISNFTIFQKESLPHFIKLLRGSIEIDQYNNILKSRGKASSRIFNIDENTKLLELIKWLENPRAQKELGEYYKLVSSEKSLLQFVEDLFQTYNYLKYSNLLRLVFIFDQFEELFTRFGETDRWKVKDDFIEQIKALYQEKKWPIKIIVCIRREFLARMDCFKSLDIDFENCQYSIDMLSEEHAKEAISKPAQIYRYDYDEDCLVMIVNDLKKEKEEKFIDPPHLQIVCEKLWEVRGRELFESQSINSNSKITKEVYDNLGRLQGILGQYFESLMNTLSTFENRQAMTILTKLITSSGHRNIVNREDLLSSLGKMNREKNEKLLVQLERQRIIRTERRLGEPFIEITHERLIDIIQEIEARAFKTINKYSYFSIFGGLIYFGVGIYFLLKDNPIFGILFSGIALYLVFFAALVLYKKVPFYGSDPIENFKMQLKNLFRKYLTHSN